MVLEYLDSCLSDQHRVSAQEMVKIVRQMLDAIIFLHESRLAHGYIQEKNFWMMHEGPLHIKLVRFKDR